MAVEAFLALVEQQVAEFGLSCRRTARSHGVEVLTRAGWEEIDAWEPGEVIRYWVTPGVPPPQPVVIPPQAWRCGYCAGLQPATSYRCRGCGAGR